MRGVGAQSARSDRCARPGWRAGLRAAAIALALALAQAALAQPLIPGADGGAEPEVAEPTLEQRVELVQRDIATRVAALGDGATTDEEVLALRELLDVLQRGLEASRVSAQLDAGRAEALERAARPPSAYFTEPPFAVPLFDAVFLSWEAQRAQRERLAAVLDDTRAALESAKEDFDEAERQRRRVRDTWEREGDEAKKASLALTLRKYEVASRVARAELELAGIALHNAEIEHAMQEAAESQAAAALAWVRDHLVPRDADLDDVIADLEKRTFDLDRALESTRLDLAAAAGDLEAARARTQDASSDEAAVRAAEVAARRLAFTAAQRQVALLGERSQRLGLAKEAWQRRYEVLAGSVEPEQSRRWRKEAEEHLDDLGRQRRIKDARLAELQGDLDELRGRILASVTAAGADEGAARAQELQQWLRAQESDYLALIQLYRADVGNLDEVLRLEERLAEELSAFDRGLELRERLGRVRSLASDAWDYELMASEDRPITVGKVTTGLLVFVFGLLVARRLARWLSRRVLTGFGIDPGVRSAIESLFFYGAVAVTFLVALRAVNIPLTAFAVLGGALALGIGFGSQTVVSNFISGLILLAERPIKAGDHIDVDGVYGMVERIGLRSTRIRTGDNFHIIVPNASFLERSVINWTHDSSTVRLKIAVGVAYGSDTRKVEQALLDVASAHKATLADPAPIVLFLDFADSALLFEVRFWIKVHDIMDKLSIQSAVRFGIDERFRADGIEIAFPQRDLHIDAESPIPVRIEERSREV